MSIDVSGIKEGQKDDVVDRSELKPPVMWGNEDYVRSLFDVAGAELTFERRTVARTHGSPEYCPIPD